jgi:hypothetical protein
MSSLELDLWAEISFDSDNGEVETYLNREAIASESHNGTLRRVHSYKWSDVFTPKITLIKQNYEDFTSEENRRILTWLTSSPSADFLDVYKDDSEVISFCVLGNFITVNQHKLANGRIVGYTAEFESVTPWALSDLQTITKDVSDPADNTITINLETDDPHSAVYPRITIQQDATTNIIELNSAMVDTDDWTEGSVFYDVVGEKYYWMDSDGKHISPTNTSNIETTSVNIKNVYTAYNKDPLVFDTLIKNNLKGEKVILDGANRVVSSSRTNGRIFGEDFDWQWIPLYHGENKLTFIGNCVVTIEYREPIKCGEF